MAKIQTVSETLRAAIRESDETMLAIATAAEIDRASMSRFMSGQRGLRLDAVDRLCKQLGLRLVATRDGKAGKR